MIYAIYPCPVSFCRLDSYCPSHHFPPPIILPPGNLLMYTIFPFPVSFCPLSFSPVSFFCPPPRFAPYHFAPYHFAPWKWFNDLHYLPMSRIILPPALDFVFILIKSPLQQKLMTGAHPGDCGTSGWLREGGRWVSGFIIDILTRKGNHWVSGYILHFSPDMGNHWVSGLMYPVHYIGRETTGFLALSYPF